MSELDLPQCPICHAEDTFFRQNIERAGRPFTWYECQECGSVLLWMGDDRWVYQKVGREEKAYLLKQPMTVSALQALLPQIEEAKPSTSTIGDVTRRKPDQGRKKSTAGRFIPWMLALCLIGCLALAAIVVYQQAGDIPLLVKGTPTPTPTPTPIPISDMFKDQITSFLQEGTKLSQMTEQGVNYADFQQQLANAKGPYDLASAMWPPGFASPARDAMDRALLAWSLALDLWEIKIDRQPLAPTEPDVLGYERFAPYVGDLIFTEVWQDWNFVEEHGVQIGKLKDVGKKFIPYDVNISRLFVIAGDSFEEGRTLILADLP